MADENRVVPNVAKELQFKGIDPDSVQCKKCEFRYKDQDGVRGATLSACECYPNYNKPISVLLYGKECDYFVKQ